MYYPSKNDTHDFTILKLASPVKLSQPRRAGIACLPANISELYTGADVTVSGWESTTDETKCSTSLKASVFNGISRSVCQSILRDRDILDEHICLIGSDKHLCHGYKGGEPYCGR
jgi:Trypsin